MNSNAIFKKEGFTIIEVLIGLVILAIGMLAIAVLQTTSVRGNYFSSNLMQASYVAQDRLELLKNVSYTDAALGAGEHPDGSTRVPDIPGGMVFNRSYTVTAVNDPYGDYLRIDYTVAWNDGVNHRVSFATVRSQ
jgi:type IV pilus assembly protein PilV